MDKEKLEKEAKEKFEQYKLKDEDYVEYDGEKVLMFNREYYAEDEYFRFYCNGYLASAEPREKRISELEETINKLREQFALRYDLEDKIKELQEQIERMKVCCNCDWSNYLPNGNCLDCDGKKNWILKEIKEK